MPFPVFALESFVLVCPQAIVCFRPLVFVQIKETPRHLQSENSILCACMRKYVDGLHSERKGPPERGRGREGEGERERGGGGEREREAEIETHTF